MMIYPSKRELELRKILKGWRVYDPTTNSFSLKPNAPEDIRRAFEELKKTIK